MGWRDRGRPEGVAERPRYLWRGGKRAFGNFYRPINTTQERRHFDPEFGRTKRSLRRLPTRWDDIPRGDYRHRSWKRHRATQYRPTNEAPTMSIVSESERRPEADAGHACKSCQGPLAGARMVPGGDGFYCLPCAEAIAFGPPPPVAPGYRSRLIDLGRNEPEPIP